MFRSFLKSKCINAFELNNWKNIKIRTIIPVNIKSFNFSTIPQEDIKDNIIPMNKMSNKHKKFLRVQWNNVNSRRFKKQQPPKKKITISLDEVEKNNVETKVSFVHHPYELDPNIPLDLTSSDKQDFFAVIAFSGTHYKVTIDDVIVANKLEKVDIGQTIVTKKVLLIGSRKGTMIGRPIVKGASVSLEVEEITKDKKVMIFKMRRRKNSKRLRGFRRPVTILRIRDISIGNEYDEFASKL